MADNRTKRNDVGIPASASAAKRLKQEAPDPPVADEAAAPQVVAEAIAPPDPVETIRGMLRGLNDAQLLQVERAVARQWFSDFRFRRVEWLRMSGVPGLAVMTLEDPLETFDVLLDNLRWRDGSPCSGDDVNYREGFGQLNILIAREKEGIWFIEKKRK
jgi:hypothetical protein